MVKPVNPSVERHTTGGEVPSTKPLGGMGTVGPLSTLESAKTLHREPDLPEEAAAESAGVATPRLRELVRQWTERGIDIGTVRLDRKGTVVPDRESQQRAYAQAPGPEAVRALPALRVDGQVDGSPEFEVGDVLGMGGMGVVKAARQTTLERQVAIKGVRPDVRDPTASPQLLLEARVTGTLEHPNVVPIHAIGRDERGHALIVMKRIEGRSWEALIGGVERTEGRLSDEQLQRHLSILLQVSRAVHFAHSRGILHRDLKPANVMIGGFGEVYVVDWGIAVGLDDRAPAGLPRARNVTSLAGTPAYMSPEMAAGDGPTLGVRTDVYLLGAMLHELLTGHAPHEAPTVLETVRRAFTSDPHDYDAWVPRDLVALCHRAMSWNPADRQADAGEFADALEAFVHHRSSTVLSDEATQRLARLDELLATVEPDDAEAVRGLRALFSEVRFAFAHARKMWTDNAAATTGLQTALEQMIAFELQAGAAGAAAALVAELPEPRPALARQVDRAVEEQRQARARLEQLERDADLSIGDRQRKILAVVGSLGWCACCVSTGLLRRHGLYPVSQLEFAVVCAGFGAALGVTAFVGRQRLYANDATRRLAQTVLLTFGAYALLWAMAHLLAIAPASTSAVSLLLGGMLWLSLALHVQRTWAGMASGMVLGLAATLLWPTYNFEWMGLGSVLGGSLTAWLRHRAQRQEAAQTTEPRSTSSPT